jgi:Ca-activated chloride channel family protein
MAMSFASPHFADPQWLWLAVLGPVLALALFRRAAHLRRRQLAALAAPHLLARLLASHSPGRRLLKQTLLVLALAVAGLALARPQWGETARQSITTGEDIVFVLDCSQSMLGTDIRPNRLSRARLAIEDFVRQHGRGRIGLVAFAGQAFLQCPLTFDYEALQESLLAVDERTIPVPGTSIGRALDEAAAAMEKNQRRKILVLITDGEDLEKTGAARARQLATNGVVVFAVGVGTAAGTSIPVLNAMGQTDAVRDGKGQVVVSRLDDRTLIEIAQATHGAYEPLGGLGEGLSKVRHAIETGVHLPHLASERTMGVDRFHWFVALLLALLVLEPLIGTRKRGCGLQIADCKSKKRSQNVLAVLLIGISFTTVAQTNPGTARTNTAPATIQPAAATNTTNANTNTLPSRAPETPRDFFNAGTRQFASGKLREAEAALQTAVAANDDTLQPGALYNLGHVRFQQGVETLKKAPDGDAVRNRAEAATRMGDLALRSADAALAGDNLDAMVRAYLQAGGARKELKAATGAVKKALETYGVVLARWQRSSGDFKSASDLRPSFTNAQFNAGVVDRHIAALIDKQDMMQQCGKSAGDKLDQLKNRMKQLKGRLPDGKLPGGSGDDEEDDDDGDQPREPKKEDGPGREREGKNGLEILISEEEALRLLESFQLDGNRKLPMGGNEPGRPADRKGRDW